MARDIAALIKAVRDHAVEHYTEGGWDYIVESYDDVELRELIGLARTVKGAIKKAAAMAELLGERRDEVVSMGDTYDYSQDLVIDDAPAPTLVVEADEAISADDLRGDGYYSPAQITTTGVACGNCARKARALGNREPQRHADVDLVRYCYDFDAMQKDRADQQAAELHAETMVERHFEERGAWEPDMWSYAASL